MTGNHQYCTDSLSAYDWQKLKSWYLDYLRGNQPQKPALLAFTKGAARDAATAFESALIAAGKRRQNRDARGAFALFYYLRKPGSGKRALSSNEAHKYVRYWSLRPSGPGPNPLCMMTRRMMEEYYDKPYQGD